MTDDCRKKPRLKQRSRSIDSGRQGFDLRFNPRRVPGDAQIVDKIVTGVMERRLRPGTKLTENTLCEVFGVSRTQIRRVFVVLGERGVVELHPNRGACVASPTVDEARLVFEARRTIEKSVVAAAARCISPKQIAGLRRSIRDEAKAEEDGNRQEAIRLSGEFHVELAKAAGNPILAKFVEQLVTRTSLIIAMFGSKQSSSCTEQEHGALLDALEKRDANKAAALMDHHLEHIERDLDVPLPENAPEDIRRVLTFENPAGRAKAKKRNFSKTQTISKREHSRNKRVRSGDLRARR